MGAIGCNFGFFRRKLKADSHLFRYFLPKGDVLLELAVNVGDATVGVTQPKANQIFGCKKAGVPQRDFRGKITSHRARSTIATQLFNAKEPMSLYELQEWLGHRLPSSTQRYAKITPTKLMRSYLDAGYFGRNLRMIEVLIDQEKVRGGVGVQEAWKFYDLGHGYCTYDFFDQCPHRLACAKCSFYMPKGSTASALPEGKNNLLRMRQEIPLTDAEAAAVDDGASALDSLPKRLANVPTPAGPTPLQLSDGGTTASEAAD